jgi:hypothetical protein
MYTNYFVLLADSINTYVHTLSTHRLREQLEAAAAVAASAGVSVLPSFSSSSSLDALAASASAHTSRTGGAHAGVTLTEVRLTAR